MNKLPAISIFGIPPFHQSMPGMVTALNRAGALGVLTCSDEAQTRLDIAALAEKDVHAYAILVEQGFTPDCISLPNDTIVILPGPDYRVDEWKGFSVLAQVTSLEEAQSASDAGVSGLIAKGFESAGRVGEDTAFMLFQKLVSRFQLPVWVQGAIGFQTAAACIAGGARGVVLEGQLALLKESSISSRLRASLVSTDEIDTIVEQNYRVLKTAPLQKSSEATALDKVVLLDGKPVIPAGQELDHAKPLERRFRTTGRLVQALVSHLKKTGKLAAEKQVLSPGSALAQEHGIRYPVFQGPMSRVSDVPGFSHAVMRAGGLPFLALAMLRGPQVEKLLAETAAQHGNTPWGVGLLGFVPKELREEQMAAIRKHRPPVALIAGGRPSQARPLEEMGIPTYLHVPSPGLLELFLKDGARRFVFEGRECGGHVGPVSSFALWEKQLEVLRTFPKPEQLSLVFAGGIHDARSAAMVAAMATPLAAKGARIGVLMGSAYLFTQEIVETGAILPEFQQVALECGRTALVETAPGHVTRCSETPYVHRFLEEKERLFSEGLSSKEVWQELEMMNLGRLRVAAKGIRREGDQLLQVDQKDQRAEGMYMIGEIATLHDRVVTLKELHNDVTQEAMKLLASQKAEDGMPEQEPMTPIAIVGMSCVFPGANDLQTFWSNIVKGGKYITEVDPERWNPDFYYDPNSRNGDKTPSKWGGFLDDVAFDPLEYGIPPQSLSTIDPTQLLSLEVAKRAHADADYIDR